MAKEDLSPLEKLFDDCLQAGVNIEEKGHLPDNVAAAFYEDADTEPTIILNQNIKTAGEKLCAVAEELGHYNTSYGNLLTDPSVDNTTIRQQETRAKRWAVKKLVSIKSIIQAYKSGCRSTYEMAEYLEVTEDFFRKSLQQYAEIYGKCKKRGVYIIYFDPPGVFKSL